MISRIRGILDSIDETTAVVAVGGIYYEIMLPSALAESMRNTGTVGTEITFHTLDYIESAQVGNQYPRLVGFAEPIDKEFFSVFTSVPGLGMKKALKSLTIPINDIARAIETNDLDNLKKLPGIGPRLAEKIVAELRGKTARFALAREAKPLAKPEHKPDFADEVMLILLQLQYKRSEAQAMLDRAIATGKRFKSSEDLLNQIFRQTAMPSGREIKEEVE
jgi:Holliday junction DNA helicase RuvA